MGLFEKIFGTHSDKEIKRILNKVNQIEDLEPKMEKLSDDELRHRTVELKQRLENGETLDDILVDAFATVREAAKRTLNMRHFRVQLIGGIILHQGRIAEMKTGEGKTLVATLPAYLNALEGKGVHIVTVNEYLAKRDAEWMGQIYTFLGLSVGVVTNDMDTAQRQEMYDCDITYVTNNELGFDYLRDNMVTDKSQLVQRELNYAIVDEVDSVLIDEARTPLIISGQSGKSTDLYRMCDMLARTMERGSSDGEISKIDAIMNEVPEEDGDFLVNEKDKHVMLTAQGVEKVEKFFNIENLADPEHIKGGETSASAFFVYALAWGINNSMLPKDKFYKAVLKGWTGLLGNICESGKVGYVQPVGAAPDSFNKESTHAYGAGAFILAACEVAKMLGASQKIPDPELLRRAQQIYDASGICAYACKVPRRQDDLAWENSNMAFRIYGPALEKSIENSGIDVWAKSVAYPVIDKWYDDDLSGKRSYHTDHGEGLDAFKVADTVGLGGTGIFKDGKLYKSNVYKCSEIYWTTPQTAKFSAFYVYKVGQKTYSERKDFRLEAFGKTCEISSTFFEGRGALRWMELGNNKKAAPAKDIVAATGLLPQSKGAKIYFDKKTKTLCAKDTLAEKPFDMFIQISSLTEIEDSIKLESGEEIIVLKPDSKGKISYKISYIWRN